MMTTRKKRQTPPGNGDSSKQQQQQQQQQGSATKKTKTTSNTRTTKEATGGDDHRRDQNSNDYNKIIAARLDPKLRGIHTDAIQVNRSAPTSASTCIDCGHKINAHSPRWGIKYAGNPLPGEPVIPLYGSHPMVMWCHAGCGLLAYIDMSAKANKLLSAAARTCHACEDTPSSVGLRLVCGGSSKGNKIRQHAFHLECWKKAMIEGCADDNDECKKALLLDIKPENIVGRSSIVHGIGWNNLTEEQKNYIRETLRV